MKELKKIDPPNACIGCKYLKPPRLRTSRFYFCDKTKVHLRTPFYSVQVCSNKELTKNI